MHLLATRVSRDIATPCTHAHHVALCPLFVPSMRPAHALIDLAALRHNYLLARQLHGGKVLAVVKANAYGHGAVRCARALADIADAFAVGLVDEALELRAAGICTPILVLEGVFDVVELDEAVRHQLWLVVHHEVQLRMIESTPLAAPLQVWLKLNTGMNRAGFAADQLADAWQRLQASGKVASITLMSHLARADEPQQAATSKQIEYFDRLCAPYPTARSLANSAGILYWPQARLDWGRPGLLLYGVAPDGSEHDADHSLRPVMQLNSAVMAVREIGAGEAVGYGGHFVVSGPTRVGLVATGYADGYPRNVANGTPVWVSDPAHPAGGQFAHTIGRVSMDMLSIDLSALPWAGIGSAVELWGNKVSVNRVARAAGSIAYELLCNVKRVKFSSSD